MGKKGKSKAWQPTPLPLKEELESLNILRKLSRAHRSLAELKGLAETIPNQNILIDTLALQEAKDSSAVENIITTHDELYKVELEMDPIGSIAAKEVQNYAIALKKGFRLVLENEVLTQNHIKVIQETLENNEAGFRTVPGTTLKNDKTGEVVYIPPQHPDEIKDLMANLEEYINDDGLQELDPLIKLAVIHFQFESIHPFYDGNGRTGRIINILYLILKDLLRIPVLYLSRYIIQNKQNYYKFLQSVRDHGDWENWIMFVLDAVEKTSIHTLGQIRRIKELMTEYKTGIRDQFKFYSQDLLNNLFRHPYTKIESVMKEVDVSRPTATSYLKQLVEHDFLEKHKMGKSNFYVNRQLFDLFSAETDLKSEI